jgi:hypothetical protein
MSMEMGTAGQRVRQSLGFARDVIANATRAAETADDAARRDPELAERIRAAAAQMYAIADVARDAEKMLADLQKEMSHSR